ncbi:DUF5615 family PIN-like protein [Myxococcota bacterium]|nr:DUF5615 family PIN-like protein [Myxococcota bacterium]
MKLLLDQNLSWRVADAVQDLFPGTRHLRDFGLERAEDATIWTFAAAEGYAIATKDDDFRQRSFVLGHPPRVVWLCLGNCTTQRVIEALRSAAPAIAGFERDEDAAFLVVSGGARSRG